LFLERLRLMPRGTDALGQVEQQMTVLGVERAL
jgi:hypothetical protein